MVHADVEIVRILVKGRRIQFGDVGESLVSAGSDHIALPIAGRLGVSFLCPLAGQNKISFPAFIHQVQRDHGKLGGSAALQKQNFVIVRDVQGLAKQSLTAVYNLFVLFRSMAHLHNGLPGSVVVQHFACGF